MRFDEDNVCSLCFGCHSYLDSHPYEKIEFFKQRLGDKLDLLNARLRERGTPDINGLTLYFREKIKELEV